MNGDIQYEGYYSCIICTHARFLFLGGNVVVIGCYAEHCAHNHKQHTQRHHGGHNGKTVVVRPLLCTGVYYVFMRRVTALDEEWTPVTPHGVHGILNAKAIAPPFEIVFVGTYI